MKKLIYFAAAVIGMMSAASCQKESFREGSSVKMQSLEICVGAKTALVEGESVVFNAGDEIAVWDGTAVQKFTTEEGGASAIFKGAVTDGATDLYVVYPYDASMEVADGKIKTTMPCKQYADQTGSFGAGANVSVGKCTVTNPELVLKNTTSLMKVTISTTDIASVVMSGLENEYVTGPVIADPETGEVSNAESYSKLCDTVSPGEVVLLPKAGNSVIEAGTYYLAVRPGTLSGVRWFITNKTGNGALRYSSEGVTLARARVRDFKTIDSGLKYHNILKVSIKTKTDATLYDGSDETGGKYSNPFNVTLPTNSGSAAQYESLTTTSGYTLTLDTEKYANLNSNSKAGVQLHYVDPGFTFGLPFFEGKRLIAVQYSNCANTNPYWTVVDSEGELVKGGSRQAANPTSTLMTWNLSGTAVGAEYKMKTNTAEQVSAVSFTQINMTYLDEAEASEELVIPLSVSDFTEAGLYDSVKKFPVNDGNHPLTVQTCDVTKDVSTYTFVFTGAETEYSTGGVKYYVTQAKYNSYFIKNGGTPSNVQLPLGAQVGGRDLKSVKVLLGIASKTIRLSYKNSDGSWTDIASYTSSSSCNTDADKRETAVLPVGDKGKQDNYYIRMSSSKMNWMVTELIYQ